MREDMNRSPVSIGIAAKHNEASAIVAQMSLKEKAAFASGKSFWHLEACERLNVPSVMVTDGPHGLRKQTRSGDHVGLVASVPATCFPTACALAASWDPQLLFEVGVALGEQCVAEDVTVLLGPGMNIKRHPLCGRNFEYFSEDPLLTGQLAAAFINGVQSQGVGTSVKHYAVNNQEYGRMFVDAIVDERTLREIYLRGFEIAVKTAQPWTVMCAYNRVNGVYCSEHDWLLNKVLRDEWGFQGLVMTDWGAANDRVLGVAGGLDLEMPSSGGVNDARVEQAVKNGHLSEALLDQAIIRNVSLALCGAQLSEHQRKLDQNTHHELARRAATQSAVLLKNEDNLLPLKPQGRVGVIGAFAQKPRYQGTGSSQVAPTQIDCAFDAINEMIGEAGEVVYATGYEPVHSSEDDALIQAAVDVAANVDVAIVFAGLPVTYESEGFDREHMRMPLQHNRLIEAVCQANPNTVVVLANGSPVEMPWIDSVRCVLESYLPGQAGGGAIADLLFGRANPCGKLAESFPVSQQDVAADRWFPGEGRQVQYREGLYVGYRYFDSAQLPVLFPFGHGLSYTDFGYDNLAIEANGENVRVNVNVSNTGERSGAEVVQLYVHDVESTMYRPEQELKAHAKVFLMPGETKLVTLLLDASAFALYDIAARDWVVQAGTFELRVGSSSRDIRLAGRVDVPSEQFVAPDLGTTKGPTFVEGGLHVSDDTFAAMLGHAVPGPESARPFHINSTLVEIEASWLGRQVKARLEREFKKNMGVGGGDNPTLEKMFNEMLMTMPLRAFPLFSRGKIEIKSVRALVALMNGQLIKALRILLGGGTPW
jgi:beta-glucosidase